MPLRQPAGEGLGVVANVFHVAGQAVERVLGFAGAVAGLIEVAALDRVAGAGQRVDIDATATVLRERLVDADGEAAGVVFQGALPGGQGLDRRTRGAVVGGTAGFFTLLFGQGTSTRGQGVGLAGLRGQGLGPERGRVFQNLVELTAEAVLFVGQPLEAGAVAGLGGLVGTRGQVVLALCQARSAGGDRRRAGPARQTCVSARRLSRSRR